MTIPTQSDIKKRQEKLKQFLKRLDADGKPQEKHVVGVVRSAIRSAWMKSDVKLAYLYMNTIPDMDDSTRTKWLCRCEMCGELFKLTDVEIDHKQGNHSFTKFEDFENYFNNILMVGFDDLQILCKDNCHAQKTYMERYGVSWEEAGYQKIAVSLIKKKMCKDWLKAKGVTPQSSAEKRRIQIVELLKKEKKDESGKS